MIKNRYQNNLEPMRGSEFVFDYVQLLYYKCYKTNLNCGGSYTDPAVVLVPSLLTLNIFTHCSSVSIVTFEQVNVD